jgi:hypothetical protein
MTVHIRDRTSLGSCSGSHGWFAGARRAGRASTSGRRLGINQRLTLKHRLDGVHRRSRQHRQIRQGLLAHLVAGFAIRATQQQRLVLAGLSESHRKPTPHGDRLTHRQLARLRTASAQSDPTNEIGAAWGAKTVCASCSPRPSRSASATGCGASMTPARADTDEATPGHHHRKTWWQLSSLRPPSGSPTPAPRASTESSNRSSVSAADFATWTTINDASWPTSPSPECEDKRNDQATPLKCMRRPTLSARRTPDPDGALLSEYALVVRFSLCLNHRQVTRSDHRAIVGSRGKPSRQPGWW